MKKRKRREPDPRDQAPLKIELPAFEIAPLEPLVPERWLAELPKINLKLPKIDLELPDIKLDPLPEIDLDGLLGPR